MNLTDSIRQATKLRKDLRMDVWQNHNIEETMASKKPMKGIKLLMRNEQRKNDEVPYFCRKLGKMSQNVSSAAVVMVKDVHNSVYFISDILIIFDTVVHQNQDGVTYAKMVAVPYLLFELSPKNIFIVNISFTR